MQQTRPFIPPTALKYIEDLERQQGILVKLLEMAYAEKAGARAGIGEVMIRRELDEGTLADLREVAAQHLYVMPIPKSLLDEQPFWRKPEAAELPLETTPLVDALRASHHPSLR